MDIFYQLLNASISLPLIPFSLLLVLVILFWLSVMIGALDIDTFDLDVDTDLEVDVDLDLEVDGDVDTGDGGAAGLGSFWASLNLGVVPVTVWISVFAIFGWFFALTVNGVLLAFVPILHALFRLLGLLLLIIPFSALLTKYAVLPLRPVFRTKDSESNKDYVREVCRVTSSKVTSDFGTAELARESGAPILINVRAREEEGLSKGDRALVLSYDEDKRVYQVTRFEHDKISKL